MRNLIYALLLVPMILLIATAVYNDFGANLDRGDWSTDANDTYDDVNSGTWSGFSLGSQLPFIYIAMTVVGAILGAFGLKQVFSGL